MFMKGMANNWTISKTPNWYLRKYSIKSPVPVFFLSNRKVLESFNSAAEETVRGGSGAAEGAAHAGLPQL